MQFSEFTAVAQNQGVEFHDEFAMQLRYINDTLDLSDLPFGFEYDPTLELAEPIIQAGRWLMSDTMPPIVSGQPFRGDPSWDASPAASTLRSLVNQSLLRGSNLANPTGFSPSSSTINVCGEAEGYFERAGDHLAHYAAGTPKPSPIGIRLFVDGNQKPTIMQKMGRTREGRVPSSITLRETTINSIVYPAGSLVCLDLIEGFQTTNQVDFASDVCIQAISFLRLSRLSPGCTGEQNPQLAAMVKAADQAVWRASWQSSVSLPAVA